MTPKLSPDGKNQRSLTRPDTIEVERPYCIDRKI